MSDLGTRAIAAAPTSANSPAHPTKALADDTTPSSARIVVYTRDDPAHATGGVETFTRRLLDVFPGSAVVAYAGAAGARRIPFLAHEARDAYAGLVELQRVVARVRPAVVVANGAAAFALRDADLAGPPVVPVYHGTYAGFGAAITATTPLRGLIARTYGAWMERQAGRARRVVVAVSARVAAEARACYRIDGPLRVIENAAAIAGRDAGTTCTRDDGRAAFELPTGRGAGPVALFIGRPETTKGFREVLALAHARPELTILGAGVAPDARWPANLRPLGVVTPARVAQAIAAADVVVLPTRYEGCSFALIEAVTADRPIVCTATGAFAEPGTHPYGVVIPLATRALAARVVAAVDAILAAPERFTPAAACANRFSAARFAAEWRTLVAEFGVATGRTR